MAGKLARHRATEFEKHASQAIQGSSIATFQLSDTYESYSLSDERFTFAGKIWNFKCFFIRIKMIYLGVC
jgi:hypothetical protein